MSGGGVGSPFRLAHRVWVGLEGRLCRWVWCWARGELLHALPSGGGGGLRRARCCGASVEVRSSVFQPRSSRGAVSPGLHCAAPVDSWWPVGRVGRPPTPVIVRVSAVPASAARACSWWPAAGVRPRCVVSFLEVFAMGHPEFAQGFARPGHASWRMSLLGQQGSYFDVRRTPGPLECCDVPVVSIVC